MGTNRRATAAKKETCAGSELSVRLQLQLASFLPGVTVPRGRAEEYYIQYPITER